MKTKRLRDLEAEDSGAVNDRSFWMAEGYKMALEDMEPVLDVAQRILMEQRWIQDADMESRCIPSIDVLGELRDALAALEE